MGPMLHTSPVAPPLPAFFSNFATAFAALFSEAACATLAAVSGPRGGGVAKLSLWQWIMARVYHELARSGTFAANVKTITRITLSDSALSQRARSIGWQLIDEILPLVLRPLADPDRQPAAFHRGYRLLALDGTRFNLRNTPAINASARKTACSKGGGVPAFAHLLGVVLVELGLHQPLAAAFGWQGEGELTLARRLLGRQALPDRCLLLADRLFGLPSLIRELLPALEQSSGAVLFRIKSNLKAKRVKLLSDGSSLVEIAVRCPDTRRTLPSLRLREITADIHYQGGSKPLALRFWTTLLDETEHPAHALTELYATRWEEELFFRELKSHLHGRGNLLDAQTPDTAAQEVLALLLAASLIAGQRGAVAEHAGVPILRISFAKVLHKTAALCELLAIGGDLITPAALAQWLRRILDDLQTAALIQARPPRSCPRTLRQPVKDWPKTKTPTSKPLVKTITITNP
jgi:hypothetical protein